jgi:hypothetical protein
MEAGALQPGRNVVDDHVGAALEALGVRKLSAVVDDVHPEAGVVRHTRERVADVSGPKM